MPQESRLAFKRDLLDRIASAPGVGSAAEVRHVPMGGTGTSFRVRLDAGFAGMRLNATTERYLETMGIPLIAGRDFERRDMGAPVAIVNRTFAERLGLENPVGQTFRAEAFWLGGRPDIVYEIVGYVPDTKYFDLREDPLPIAFVPVGLIPDPRPYTDYMIRSTMPDGAVAAAVRDAIREVSPAIRTEIRPFNETIRNLLLPERLMAMLAGFFGILAALVAAVGLYGVIAFLVVQRTTEIGIRMALGATSRGIPAMVLAQAARILTAGCAAGTILALAGAGLVRSLVFGVEPHSLATIGLAAILLAAVGAAACCIPAARAAAVQPRDALRNS